MQQAVTNRYFETAAAYWRDVYSDSSVGAQVYRDRRDSVLRLVDQLGVPAGERVLEVGCGAGFTALALAMRGYAVDAVDSVEKMIHITRDSACSANVGHLVVTQVGDVHQLPYADNSFPLVLAIGVLPWLPALQDPLKELARVLRPGGHLIVTADNVLGVFRLLDPIARLSQIVGTILRHARLRSKGAVARMHAPWTVDSALMKAGLLKQRSFTVGFGPFTVAKHKLLGDALGLRLHKVLQRCADRDVPVIRVLGSHYVVVACKPTATY